jgi:resuscitation-promoting factor RpfB
VPVPSEPTPQEPSGCDPNYTGCVPIVSYDLDCADIGFSVQVIGVDIHGFDSDSDGWGCEAN